MTNPQSRPLTGGVQDFPTLESVQRQAADMRAHFVTGTTRPPEARRAALRTMKHWLKTHEREVLDALQHDLGRAPYESYVTELGLVYEEIDTCMRKLGRWARPRRVPIPLTVFHSTSTVYPYPYGVVLVLSPWNYPVQLTLIPMVDAIAAGNCVAFKPARESAATAAIMLRMAREAFDPRFVCGIPGSANMNDWILETHWDYIMFTGSPHIGKVVMAGAAKFLTPVTLELGGKSPCFVHRDANLKIAARRIAWGKAINTGQTCVAPDYLLVHEDVADELCRLIEQDWRRFYGDHPLECEYWPHMISDRHFKRVMGLIANHNPNAKVACGGHGDERTLKIEPTIMRGVTLNDPVMGEEIFGPVLPVITYRTLDEAMRIARTFPHPLACYVFTGSKRVEQRVIHELQFGGGAVNDVCVHMSNNHMGFGGVGNSGMGAYHGKVGFDTFTHYKSVMKHGTWLDPTVRYPPFTPVKKAIAHLLMH